MEHTINQGADVKTVAWHPQKGLLVCGDKNFVITLLDPRTGSKLRTIYDHKGEVSVCKWNKNGNLFLSASRDQSIKLCIAKQCDSAYLLDCRCGGRSVTAIDPFKPGFR